MFNVWGKFCEKLHFGSPKIDKTAKTSCLPISNHPILTWFKYGLNTYFYILNLKYHEILINLYIYFDQLYLHRVRLIEITVGGPLMTFTNFDIPIF